MKKLRDKIREFLVSYFVIGDGIKWEDLEYKEDKQEDDHSLAANSPSHKKKKKKKNKHLEASNSKS